MKVVWEDKKVLAAIGKEADRVAKRGASLVAMTAKNKVPKREHNLVNRIIRRKSKYEGWIVWAQPPGTASKDYYALFVEYGHAAPYQGRAGLAKSTGRSEYSIRMSGVVKKTVAARPFMRPAIKKWRRYIMDLWRKQIT
jgi:hypothetical protein